MKTERVLPAFESRFLNMMEASFVDNAGNNKKWFFAQRPKNTGVVFVAAVVNKVPAGVKTFQAMPELVVIREYRVPVGAYVYSIPAGLIDPGETVVEAAKRELEEETGLTLKYVLSTTPPLYSSPGMSDEAASLVYVEAEGDISYNKHEVAEDITVFLMNKESVGVLIRDHSLKFDAKAYMVFKQFATYGVLI
jgi:ADP-ribose pyrophosphatase